MRAGHEQPVDRVAARVIKRGDDHHYVHSLGCPDTPLPIPTKAAPRDPRHVDLTGLRVGRLTVVGVSAVRNKRWVCRCACGMYTHRTSAALKKGIAAPCTQCYKLAMARRSEHYRRTGKELEVADFL